MSSEIDLYRRNVPHGDGAIEYADWSSAQATITVTAGTSTEIYVNRVRFIAGLAFAMSAGSFTIAGDEFSHQVDSPFELYAMADTYTLKNVILESTNQYIVGEIKFNPPLVIDSADTFTITPNTLTMTGDLHLAIEYWEDTPAT